MRKLNLRGKRHSPYADPIARFLARVFTSQDVIAVGETHIHINFIKELPLPYALLEFRKNFDAGKYPDLEEPSRKAVS